MKKTSRRTVLLKGGDMKKTSRRTVLLKGGDMKRIDLEGNRAAKMQTILVPLKHLKGIGITIGMTLLSDWLKCAAERTRYRRGHRTTTTTQRYVMACCINILKKAVHATFVQLSRAALLPRLVGLLPDQTR